MYIYLVNSLQILKKYNLQSYTYKKMINEKKINVTCPYDLASYAKKVLRILNVNVKHIQFE